VMPSSAGAPREWRVVFHSDDPDEPNEPDAVVDVRAQPVQLPPCNLMMTPALSFGLVASGSRDLPLVLQNVGTTPCLVSALDLAPGSPPFFALPNGPQYDVDLPAGATLTVAVRVYAGIPPPASLQAIVGNLVADVSSPTQPRRQVALSAQVGPGCLLVSP